MRIAIIGTGVAGSLVAEMLAGRHGFSVRAFDRLAAGEESEAGTGLNVGPNAMKALRLYLPERHDAVRAASLPWTRWFIDTAAGERLAEIDLLRVAEEPGIRLRWSELYRVLRAPVAHLTRHSAQFTALEEAAGGRLRPIFRGPDGTLFDEGDFDLLIGCDGRYSRLREITDGPVTPRFFGVALTRLLVPDAADCPFDEYGQWFNGHARLLAFPLPGGAAYIAGSVPLPSPEAEVPAAFRAPGYQPALYEPAGALPCPAVAWMCAKLRAMPDQIHWARLQESPLLRHTMQGRVVLLGDAAQGMVPTLGQGATQAIEDAVLAGAVLRGGGGAAQIAALRDPRVEWVRRFSVASTDTMLRADPVSGSRQKGKEPFLSMLRQLYTYIPSPD
jgi:2-polyprenyl-6-methoxyphenol hydroxylase-like FAD-dependent oxidoreductase